MFVTNENLYYIQKKTKWQGGWGENSDKRKKNNQEREVTMITRTDKESTHRRREIRKRWSDREKRRMKTQKAYGYIQKELVREKD